MATKETYDCAKDVLRAFILGLKNTGEIRGFSYSFSPRKATIEELASRKGVIIRKDSIYVHGETHQRGTMHRPLRESDVFQLSCINEYCSDKEIEDLIKEAFTIYHLHLSESLYVGEWED